MFVRRLFFTDSATTEIYTLSLHDALPILGSPAASPSMPAVESQSDDVPPDPPVALQLTAAPIAPGGSGGTRSEEHTSELQSHSDLVCRLLLEKKKKKNRTQYEAHQDVKTR